MEDEDFKGDMSPNSVRFVEFAEILEGFTREELLQYVHHVTQPDTRSVTSAVVPQGVSEYSLEELKVLISTWVRLRNVSRVSATMRLGIIKKESSGRMAVDPEVREVVRVVNEEAVGEAAVAPEPVTVDVNDVLGRLLQFQLREFYIILNLRNGRTPKENCMRYPWFSVVQPLFVDAQGQADDDLHPLLRQIVNQIVSVRFSP